MKIDFKLDSIAKESSLKFEDLKYKVHCHQDVLEGMVTHNLSPKTTMAIRQIIAFGVTNVAKGCSDSVNKGWLRSPLGGAGGFHFYLWWTRKGSNPTKDLNLMDNDIVIRAIRHHDDHTPLKIGDLTDYDTIERQDLVKENGYYKSPWNAEQIAFVQSDKPIRIAQGKPGSGKTTVLWESVDLRTNQKVLYVTWSQKLINEARKHFTAFAPLGTSVIEHDFSTIVSQICGTDIPRQSLAKSRDIFLSSLPQGSKKEILGPWIGLEKELFAEIRAYYFGSINFGSDSKLYLETSKKRIDKYGGSVVKIVSSIIEKVSIEKIFPELHFANIAINRLRDGYIPSSLDGLSRIVVDEIQDLSMLELQVFVELCKAIHKSSGLAPLILMAGDEGQTVRPSGFEWASVNTLIRDGLEQNAENIPLAESVRYPGAIAEVLDRASDLYSTVQRSSRPRKQSKSNSIDYRQAHLFHINVKMEDDPNLLIKELLETEKCTIICPAEEFPDWLDEDNRSAVLSPMESKGLEFQTVCILDPGKEIASITEEDKNNRNKFENLNLRTRIDQLRVAISRATETLVFINIDPSNDELKESLKLLKNSTPFEKNDLLDHLNNSDVTPEERVVNRINNARTLIETRPERAWQLVNQAVKLLGEPDLHNGVSDRGVRKNVAQATVEIGLRIISEDQIADLNDDVVSSLPSALKEFDSVELTNGVMSYAKYAVEENSDPFDFLLIIEKLKDDEKWFSQSISSRYERLKKAIQDGPELPRTARYYSNKVESWLQFVGSTGDESDSIKKLRRKAIDKLINFEIPKEAEKILNLFDQLEKPDHERKGKILHALAKFSEAAKSFEDAEAYELAVDEYRIIADWKNASRVADKASLDLPDLQAILKLEASINALPNNLSSRLHQREREALGALKTKF
uniref:hypothetical protein n=1 Tax=Limnohabitans sp. TaxID=1907725 RepID=UPI004048847D